MNITINVPDVAVKLQYCVVDEDSDGLGDYFGEVEGDG